MNGDGYRINGSVGFSISEPIILIHMEVAEEVQIIDERIIRFNEKEIEKLKGVISQTINIKNLKLMIKCKIESSAFPHYGLGSNTAIYMSCIEGLLLLNGIDYTHKDIIRLSGRGGTSGIGINTYFKGGFVFDVGIKNNEEQLKPSSIAKRRGKLPLVISECKLPDWEIGVCIPTFIKNKSEQEEIDFFEKFCPVDKAYIGNILYEAVYGITASIIESDYDVFCKSINAIQSTKWKSLERSIYGKKLIDLENKIKSVGSNCVGMSSLGPLLFFTGKNIHHITREITRYFPETICYNTSFNNRGRIIKHD